MLLQNMGIDYCCTLTGRVEVLSYQMTIQWLHLLLLLLSNSNFLLFHFTSIVAWGRVNRESLFLSRPKQGPKYMYPTYFQCQGSGSRKHWLLFLQVTMVTNFQNHLQQHFNEEYWIVQNKNKHSNWTWNNIENETLVTFANWVWNAKPCQCLKTKLWYTEQNCPNGHKGYKEIESPCNYIYSWILHAYGLMQASTFYNCHKIQVAISHPKNWPETAATWLVFRQFYYHQNLYKRKFTAASRCWQPWGLFFNFRRSYRLQGELDFYQLEAWVLWFYQAKLWIESN